MSDKSDLPDPDAQGCTSEFDPTLPTTCTPVKGKFTVSVMPDTTEKDMKSLLNGLKHIVKKGMDSGRYENAEINKAIYVGDRNLNADDSTGDELIVFNTSVPLLMTIYVLAGTCLVLLAAVCCAMRRRSRDKGHYLEGDESSFGDYNDKANRQSADETYFNDYMMERDDASFDAMLPAGHPYESRQSQNGEETLATELSNDARGVRSQSKSKSRSRSKRGSRSDTEPAEMEAQIDYLGQDDEVVASTLDQVNKRRTHSRSKSKPKIDSGKDQRLSYPRSQSAPGVFTKQKPQADERSCESSDSTESSSGSAANRDTNEGNTEEPSANLLRASSTPSPTVSPTEARHKRMEEARNRASKRRSIN